jgi:hypothetical protein
MRISQEEKGLKRAGENCPIDFIVSRTTSTYSYLFLSHSRLVSSEQNVQECDATKAQ